MSDLSSQQKMIQTVINKAWDDSSFMQELVSSPRNAIKAATGTSIPEEVSLFIHDQTDPNTIYINIPPRPNYSNMELSDEQLEIVAGGEVVVAVGAITASVTAAGTGYMIGKDSRW